MKHRNHSHPLRRERLLNLARAHEGIPADVGEEPSCPPELMAEAEGEPSPPPETGAP